MAYALDEDTDEQTTGQAPVGGASTPTGIQASQGQPATGGGSAPTGNKFIGFDQYLRANEGAAQRTGERLARTAETKGQGAMQGIQRAQTDFFTKMQQGTGGLFGQPAPTTAAGAETLGATTYTGPKEFREVASPELYKQVQEAGDYARNLGTETGRQAILQQGQPGSYSGFQSTLDAALAGAASPAGRFERLNQLYGSGGLGKYLKGVEETTARTAGQTAKAVGAEAERLKGLAPGLRAQDERTALLADSQARDAATQQRNEAKRGEYLATRTPVSDQVFSTTDEQAALGYGDRVYNQWVEAGRPEFSGWIRSKRRR